jgi:hypothetical protein
VLLKVEGIILGTRQAGVGNGMPPEAQGRAGTTRFLRKPSNSKTTHKSKTTSKLLKQLLRSGIFAWLFADFGMGCAGKGGESFCFNMLALTLI